MIEKIEVDLTKKEGLYKLTELLALECLPLYKLDAELRERLISKGEPLTIDEARRYLLFLENMEANSHIIVKLIEQALKQQQST